MLPANAHCLRNFVTSKASVAQTDIVDEGFREDSEQPAQSTARIDEPGHRNPIDKIRDFPSLYRQTPGLKVWITYLPKQIFAFDFSDLARCAS